MADNIIKVNVTANKTQRVTVSSANVGTEITASSDTGKFWAQNAKNWAVSENIVDGEDYSSKYYANKSKGYAQNAESFEAAARETYNSFVSDANGYVNELTELKDAGAVEINEVVAIGKDEINSTKTTILNDIEFVADGEKKEIEDLIDSGKEELKESIGDVKVLTTLEIGDIGFTQMAIDETKGKRRILNGQLIIQEQYVQFTNIIKESVALNTSLACTESEWQTEVTMNTFGLCGKFVIDDNAGTIRLPKYPNYFIAGLANIAPVIGNGKALALTNGTITGGIGTYDDSSSVVHKINPGNLGKSVATSGASTASPGSPGKGSILGVPTPSQLGNDLSLSGIEAQLDEKQIVGTYFIQVATGAETEDNIINEIELNNPFSLLDYKYSEYELNNISWLRSNGQYNSKITYPAVYDLLLKIYNGAETKAGVSVKLSTETYGDYDFVLNTTDETFRLPIKVKLASGKAVVGNGMTLGMTDGTQEMGLYFTLSGGTNRIGAKTYLSGSTVGSDPSSTTGDPTTNKSLGVTTNPDLSGIETSDNGLYLYFYVGETVQNANLINAGRIEEIKANRSEVDGQWTRCETLLFGGVTFTADEIKSYDLSNILPNDGYDYECVFSAYIRTGKTSGNAVGCSLISGSKITSDNRAESGFATRVARCVTRTSADACAQGGATLPIFASDKAVSWYNIDSSGTSGSCGLALDYYRRIGKNV